MSRNEFSQVPGYYRLLIGDIEVICVNDGSLSSDINAVTGVSPEECGKLFAESFFPEEPRCTTNVFIIRSQGRTALVDAGGGPHLDTTAGKLFENAAAAGVSPKDIDTILFTHIHPDHVSGLLDSAGGRVFPHVTIKMARSEQLFWLSDKPASKEVEHVKHEADHVIRFLTPYADQIEPFVDGEVFPGVTVVPLPGHTPGHTGYLIKSNDEELLIWGDVVHWPIVQFRRPDAAMSYDVDPIQAAATRRRILEEAASSGRLVAGMHLFFPGLTRIRRDGGAFAMVPYPWGHADAIRSLQGQETVTSS
ncbi:MBL fold metallo-hydrolase [Rhizobium leguminosarum]|uniref:MBL fold metallo-hydrolase n=1 Tax=Rhizobium leguminosarum TaxID=384 RepID=UPI001C93AA78|nr:MBL fold metallo-hydrolase [Rhizobium leguminosarum]MBY5646365.1 MBL fold metallo-hydrolase [Rhizobium leguminosarum]